MTAVMICIWVWQVPGSDDQTTSTSYPFYVELDSSEKSDAWTAVYIERDIGQDEKKDGLWLSDYYILDTDTNEPYVWAASDKNRLEKRYVTLGEHDDDLGEYKIVEGLTKKMRLHSRQRSGRRRKNRDRRSGSDNERRRGRDYRYGC